MVGLVVRATYRGRRRYLGYLLAATVAVAVCCAFATLVFHPDLALLTLPDVVVQVLVAGQIGVALFAVFLVLFFHRLLLRLRGTELGLLLTLGVAPRQLGRMIGVESLLLAVVACVLGLTLSGALAAGLLRGLSAALGVVPLRTTLSPQTLIGVGLFFGLVFSSDAVLSARLIHTTQPKQFLVAARLRQSNAVVSGARIAGGFGCLATAYWLALVVSATPLGSTLSVLPIVALCAAGTYIIFAQVLTRVLSAIRPRMRSGLGLLLVGRLSDRVRDEARVLTVIALLNTGVIVLLSVVVGALAYVRETATSPAEAQAMLQIVAVTLLVSVFLSALCGSRRLSRLSTSPRTTVRRGWWISKASGRRTTATTV